ncbi:hypothetical protein SAMD00019534_074240 [Acytostelium subglobosum LB1]|uniref:hypothetical protein n=1 Tax=Acytostelium subglobosum LB1 TaxID=1410327 RepID=UPI000644D50F|nr:hypothetical protein SAMD00019534_074240 [Acytostelium subglobosum LB1]GAM24249.1 hypothetical protein SAMD00019534_074240 [Acytostelium subglobosum LB1]|eukprot:XP_012752575.1 hypothetical protein SAMD00019534_074240 [Acytostelium subglobosum LB1]
MLDQKDGQIQILVDSLKEFGEQMELLKEQNSLISTQLELERMENERLLKEKKEMENNVAKQSLFIDEMKLALKREKNNYNEYRETIESRGKDMESLNSENSALIAKNHQMVATELEKTTEIQRLNQQVKDMQRYFKFTSWKQGLNYKCFIHSWSISSLWYSA